MRARHQLLEGAIGVFEEEEDAYQRVKLMSWLLPIIILAGALLDLLFIMTYMWSLHPWIDILSKDNTNIEGVQQEKRNESESMKVIDDTLNQEATTFTDETSVKIIDEETTSLHQKASENQEAEIIDEPINESIPTDTDETRVAGPAEPERQILAELEAKINDRETTRLLHTQN